MDVEEIRAFLRRPRRGSSPARPAEVPSDDEKHAIIANYARGHGCRVLVETGTYRGDTIAALVDVFDRLYTIELNPKLAVRARRRFRRVRSVAVIEGDSYSELARILPMIDEPAVFWLDAHFSKGVESARGEHDPPVMWELDAVLEQPQPHVVLIDDARLMGSIDGYPTLNEIRAAADGRCFEVEKDIIRITPSR